MNPGQLAKKTFYCKLMECSGVTLRQCIKRHISTGSGRSKFGDTYVICAGCPEGATNREKYPEVLKMILNNKPSDKSKGLKRMNSLTTARPGDRFIRTIDTTSVPGSFETYYKTEPRVEL